MLGLLFGDVLREKDNLFVVKKNLSHFKKRFYDFVLELLCTIFKINLDHCSIYKKWIFGFIHQISLYSFLIDRNISIITATFNGYIYNGLI